jgi:hypothetical protein
MYEAEEERVPAFGSFISACGAAARIIAHRTFIPTTTATAATTNSAFSHKKVKAQRGQTETRILETASDGEVMPANCSLD